VLEIELHPMNMNREDSFSLNRSWQPFIHTLKECKTPILKDNRLGLEKGSFSSSLFDPEGGTLLLFLLWPAKGQLLLILLFPAKGQSLLFHPCPVKVAF
jgi:hypothetical protein